MRIDTQNVALAEPVRATAAPPASTSPAAKPDPVLQFAQAAHAADSHVLDEAIKSANDAVRQLATNISFEKDDSTGRLVVKVIDSETQKVLRQMPSEEMLSLTKAMDRMRGLMIHLKV